MLTLEALKAYDHIILYFSGGKDSLACLLLLLLLGVDKDKIEIWHHEVDGREGSTLMDWPVTPVYCRAVAGAFDIPIYFSWKVGGFEREMLRNEARTAPTKFETPEGGVVTVGGKRGKLGTRLKFPQVSADLSVRWCSSYLKIDVAAAAIQNQDRFLGKRVLTISGERAEESPGRSRYAVFEPDRTDNRDGKRRRRHVDRWRPVHAWEESQVWEIIERYKVVPHPAYYAGWGRCSCRFCIFGNARQWASARQVDPGGFETIAIYESDFGCTIKRGISVIELADQGTPYDSPKWAIKAAMSTEYTLPVFVDKWVLPLGAYGESCGPV